ncbi:MAG TPA: hypothetical protein H9796_12255 [Candidatus Butyricimonas faecavium]|nr:hypothetical protein [Candidatus Butyricimonas faecavium]
MEFKKEEDRLNRVIRLLNSPELLEDPQVQEWLSEDENRSLYEECRRYLEAGLRLTVGERVDVEGEYRNFIRQTKANRRSGRIVWISVAAAVIVFISASWWLIENSLSSKKQETIQVA